METVITYLIKSSALLLLFYATYYFLLKRNTFFVSNRWFLLSGIFCAALIPLLSFQKIVWVEPVLNTVQVSEFVPITETLTAPLPPTTSFEIQWEMVVALLYGIGVLIFLTQLIIEFYSLRKIIKHNKRTKEDGFELIEVTEAIAPFSFFRKIVYNRNQFQREELQNIIEHEKIHARQMHSLDVLIARIHCIFFWWNPLVWLYKKAIVQNLEFIADQNALAKAKDKKSYLLTLLKITTTEKNVAITNHFYQSLIKKRIIMLNKNQSKKHHSWKYFVVLPALIFFMLTYQVEVVAQVRESRTDTKYQKLSLIEINAQTSTEELKEISILFDKEYDVTLEYSKLRRDKNGNIIAIKVAMRDKNSKSDVKKVYEILGDAPIKSFKIYIGAEPNEQVEFGYGENELYRKRAKLAEINYDSISTITDSIYLSKAANTPTIFDSNARFTLEINAKVSDENFEQYLHELYNKFELYLRIDKIKRNKQKEITTLNLSLIDKNDHISSYEVSGNEPIKPFIIYAGYDKNKKPIFGFGANSKNKHLKNHFKALKNQHNATTSEPKQVIMTSNEENNEYTIEMVSDGTVTTIGKGTKSNKPTFPKNTLLILDGKIISEKEMQMVDANTIKSVSVIKRNTNSKIEHEKLFKKYGRKAKNGIIIFETNSVQNPAEKNNSG